MKIIHMEPKISADETLITMKEGKRLPCPQSPSRASLRRWCVDGLKVTTLPERPYLVLESLMLGGDLYTSLEAYDRWVTEYNRLRREGISQRRASAG